MQEQMIRSETGAGREERRGGEEERGKEGMKEGEESL